MNFQQNTHYFFFLPRSSYYYANSIFFSSNFQANFLSASCFHSNLVPGVLLQFRNHLKYLSNIFHFLFAVNLCSSNSLSPPFIFSYLSCLITFPLSFRYVESYYCSASLQMNSLFLLEPKSKAKYFP